ncbi:MAG: NADH-quinone oxidoreductase subunit K, partial [Thermoanaerobaculum sp.]
MVSVRLLACGLVGLFIRRNFITVLMSVELFFNAA